VFATVSLQIVEMLGSRCDGLRSVAVVVLGLRDRTRFDRPTRPSAIHRRYVFNLGI
jgi:hypothetical protein